MSEDFVVSQDIGSVHSVGDAECQECWSPPIPCTCGGLIHSDFGDEDSEGDYYLLLMCDKCGHDFVKKDYLQ